MPSLLLFLVPLAFSADPPMLTLTEADTGKTIAAKDAARVVIRLRGNPTTGFSWAVTKLEGDALEQVGKVEYEQDAAAPGSPPGRVGAGGTFTATFRVARPGKAVIQMAYARPWEKDTPPAQTFRVTVDTAAAPATQPATAPASRAAVLTIEPYWLDGAWVFDDPRVGLKAEPFVRGVPKLIDDLVKDIPNARRGFRLTFSASPFPGHTARYEWRRAADGGNWYYSPAADAEGWLCPALYKYFRAAPKAIYAKAEPQP